MQQIICAGSRMKLGPNTQEWFPAFNWQFTIDYLEKSFDVEYINHDHTEVVAEGEPPRERDGNRKFMLFGRPIYLPINSLVIANKKTEKYVILSSFYNLRMLVNDCCNLDLDKLITVFSGHYTQKIVDSECQKFSHKFKPWYFRTWRPDFGEPIFYSKKYEPKINKLFFRGVNIPSRRDFVGILKQLSEPEIDVDYVKIGMREHEEECQSSRVCLSVPGIRDMCNRDVEYWKGGIPFIRPRFTNQLAVDIPDEVYIPIDYETVGTYNDMADPKAFASLVIEKYEEVKSNQKLLNDVSKAGLDFYEKYFTYDKIAKNSYRMLEESGLFEE